MRTLGDGVTRLDRIEPDLNQAVPGDPRDTTTPRSLGNAWKLLLAERSPRVGEQLTKWMLGNKTGDTRLRAQLSRRVAHRRQTGAGERGTNNDVGVLWPPDGKPIVVAVYLTGTSAPVGQADATLAAVGRAIAGRRPEAGG